MNILGFFEKFNIALVENNCVYFVFDRNACKVIYFSEDEDECTKMFIKEIEERMLTNRA